jgi:signal transduction histidine kinase
MSRAARLLIWWLDPWMRIGSGSEQRAGRILLACGVLAGTVLPAMMLGYGLDGWLWPLTGAVLLCGPLGTLLLDQLAEWWDRGDAMPAAPSTESARVAPARRLSTGLRLLSLFGGLAVGLVVAYALMFALPLLAEQDRLLLANDYRRSMTILFVVAFVVGGAGALLWYRTEAFRLQAAVERARFETLKQQLQPHFLFNSLNSLKELISEDAALAEEATQRIADLYRLLLEVSKHATATLADELAIVENYLAIEQIRFRERLRVRFDVERGTEALHVPSLMLQTLVENAVKHGIGKARAGGEVSVHAALRDDGWLALTVANTGAPWVTPSSAPRDARTPTGLENTQARLELMYGAPSDFEIAGAEGQPTSVSFAVSGRRVDG